MAFYFLEFFVDSITVITAPAIATPDSPHSTWSIYAGSGSSNPSLIIVKWCTRSVKLWPINFSDDLGRLVVMVGLPYPNKFSPELKEKMAIHPGRYSTNEFILNPVSASATIKRNCSEKPLSSKKTPRSGHYFFSCLLCGRSHSFALRTNEWDLIWE